MSATSIGGKGAVSVFARDLWLVRATNGLRPYFASSGLTLPKRISVQVGQPQSGIGRSSLGECWPSGRTSEGVPGIVINDSMSSPVTVLQTLVHELIHAADDCRDEHGSWFAAWAQALGLIGAPRSTVAGPRLRKRLVRLARHLGPYPASGTGYLVFPTGKVAA